MSSLAGHKRALHEGVKFSCRQCNHQATTKRDLAQHENAEHGGEGIQFLCMQFNHQANLKGNIVQQQRAVYEGIKYPCKNCSKQLSNKKISQYTKEY